MKRQKLVTYTLLTTLMILPFIGCTKEKKQENIQKSAYQTVQENRYTNFPKKSIISSDNDWTIKSLAIYDKDGTIKTLSIFDKNGTIKILSIIENSDNKDAKYSANIGKDGLIESLTATYPNGKIETLTFK